MELTYGVTQEDFYECRIASRDRTIISRWVFRLLAGFVILLPVGWLLWIELHPNKYDLFDLVPKVIVAALLAILLWVLPRRLAREQFRKQPAARGQTTVILDDSGAHWRWDGGSAHWEWKSYLRFLESKHHFLLYTSPYSFHIVPKRAITPQQIFEVRAILEQHLAVGQKGTVPAQSSS